MLIGHIEDVDYITADKSFDALGLLYFFEFIRYSEVLEEEKEKELITGTLEELTSRLSEWREIIDLQEKWGTIK
jgi:hypothetical protein